MRSASRMNWYKQRQPRNDCAGHVVRQVGHKEFDYLGAILDGPEPPKGDQLGSIPIALNAAWNDRRHDPPGGDHRCDAVTVIPNGPRSCAKYRV